MLYLAVTFCNRKKVIFLFKAHLYTKDEIRTIIELWSSKSMTAIAQELKLNSSQINYIAHQIRKAGYKLPKKHIAGRTQNLIKELIKEL